MELNDVDSRESVNFAPWIEEEASPAEEQLDQAIDSSATLKSWKQTGLSCGSSVFIILDGGHG